MLAIGFAFGFGIRGMFTGEPAESVDEHGHGAVAKEATIWTCSMHPQIRQQEPGLCPLCNMDLIPAVTGSAGPRVIEFTEDSKKLMQIQTTPVERRFVQAKIRMVGKIDFDETRVKNITAWTPGRIDRLYVDYTGIQVNKGDHMVYLYSPQLLSAQSELLQAVKAAQNVRKRKGSELINKSIFATLEASRGKLRLLGLNKEQIKQIEESEKPVDHLTIFAPIGGIVIEKFVSEGMYVQTGTKIYTVADLSKLWVKLDAYESDMMWIRYGQQVEFSTEAYPGEVFEGMISFIDPVLDARTRTVKLRVNVDNTLGKLKPGMFVRAIVRPKVAQSGMVMDEKLAGKWICSMHPDIVKDEPGTCDICQMDLVTSESMGFVKLDSSEPPLIIPASAPLITGKRAVVYVQLPNTEKPTYEGREIVLGPRAGDYYIVKSGLEVGEVVVTNGNFKIDSALQLQAKPSMMSMEPDEPKAEVFDTPDEFKAQVDDLLSQYFKVQSALAGDNLEEALAANDKANEAIEKIDMAMLVKETHAAWMNYHMSLIKAIQDIAKANDIKVARQAFESFSNELTLALKTFGMVTGRKVYILHCPMAFDNKGAHWLQLDDKTQNPYFGSEMLMCGEVVETIPTEKHK